MLKLGVFAVSVAVVAASWAGSAPVQADDGGLPGITGLRPESGGDGMMLEWDKPCTTESQGTVTRELPGDVAPSSPKDGNEVGTIDFLCNADISNVADGRDHTFSVFKVADWSGPSAPVSVTMTGTQMSQDVSPTETVAGAPVTITGRLTDSSGAPLAGQTVLVYDKFYEDDDGRALLGTTTTAEDGTYTYVDHPTHNMRYTAWFGGTSTLMNLHFGPGTDVSVAPETRLVARRHSGHRRTTFTLRAGVTPVRGAAKTRTVTLQTLRGGRWLNVKGHHLSRTGRTSFKIRPGSHGRHHYRLYKWPNQQQGKGVSRTVTLTVG